MLGEILFSGENDADEKIQYAQIKGTILDNTDGTEDGELRLSALTSGSNQIYQRMTANLNILYQDILLKNAKNIQFEGATDDAFETTLTVTDPTADRTITLPDASGTVLLNTGNQSITGDLTVTDNIQMQGSTYTNFSDWWGSGDNSAFFTPYGYLGSNGAFAVSLFSNGYRNNGGTFTSMGINSNSTASGIELYPTGEIKFRTGTPSGTTVPERMSLDNDRLKVIGDIFISSTDAGSGENPNSPAV